MNELLDLIGNLKDCPWASWAPATLKFCEAHACSSIAAPAETWSNLPYLFAGLCLLARGLRAPTGPRGLANLETRFGLYAIVVAICSGLFHASYTYIFETADLAAMNFLGIEMVIQALKRLGWMKGHSPIALGSILFASGLIFLLGTEKTDRLLVFAAFVAVALWLETLIFVRERRTGKLGNYRGIAPTFALFGAAYAFWVLDYTGLVCAPERHWFSGHAAWHALSAGVFLTLSRFYRTR